MLPILYKTTSSIVAPANMEFVGRLAKCEKCSVTEQINNEYSLSATFSPTDELIDEIQAQRFIFAKPNPTDDPQYFEIYNVAIDEIGKVTVKARHIKHCAYNNLIKSDFAQGAQTDTPQGHWDFCCQPADLIFANYFTFSSPISTTAPMEIGYTKADTIGIFLEKLAEAFGGEYHYNNFDIALLQSRGIKKNFALRWNKNLSSPSLTLDTAQIYSHVVAYADFTAKYSSGDVDYEYPIQLCSDFWHITGEASALNKIFMYNCSNFFHTKEIKPTDYATTKSMLNAYGRSYARGAAATELSIKENVNLTIKYMPALDEMAEVGLGDTVDVILKGGRTVEAKITKTTYDVLAERWESVVLGKEKLQLSDYIAKPR